MYAPTRRRSSSSGPALFLAIPLLLALIMALQLLRGTPALQTEVSLPATLTLGEARSLALPATGSTSVEIEGLGIIGSAGPAAPRPIASLTKMMTAYVVLKDHPLKPGESGPIITISTRDASRYVQMIIEDQSALPVSAGLQFSEFEALQAMLIPSANNFAEILAAWNSGGLPAFVTRMNAEAQALGMKNTRYADVSGFDAGSVSTPQDQLLLARTLMQNPLFAQIVAMKQVRLQGIGTVPSTNEVLGVDGINGIKTGLTDAAGANLAFSAQRSLNGQSYHVIGVVMGQTSRPGSFDSARQILSEVSAGLKFAHVVAAGQPVASVHLAWGDAVDIVVGEDVQALTWPGMDVQATVTLDGLKPSLAAGTQVGWLELKIGDAERKVPLKLAKALPGPGLAWRLTRT